jgi:CXXX repeat modification system protein
MMPDEQNQEQAVGKVTEAERDEIKRLHERKNSLQELFYSLANMPRNEIEGTFLYEKLVDDMGKTASAFKDWWNKMGAKYKWASRKGHSWRINFDTCEIFLIDGDQKCHTSPISGQPSPCA